MESSPAELIDVQYNSGKTHLQTLLKFHQDPVAAIIIKTHITKEQFKNGSMQIGTQR